MRTASIDDKLQDLIAKSDIIVKLLQGQLDMLNAQKTSVETNLTGTLDNTGDTLALDSTLGTLQVNGGTIQGGNITGTAAELLFTTNSGNRLNGVTLDLNVNLSSSSVFKVGGGLTLKGTATLGAGRWIVFDSLTSGRLAS